MCKQGFDRTLVELKEAVLKKFEKYLSQWGDNVLRYQGLLCVHDVDDFRQQILSEAHSSQYSIHPGDTKMYLNLQKVYWWNGMKKYIMGFVDKCHNVNN